MYSMISREMMKMAIRWKTNFKNHNSFVIAGTLLLITLFSLLLRITPFLSGNPDVISNVGMDDPTYQLRRVELGIANFPQFGWFDPMTFFPEGQPMHWGPLFPVMSSALCILFGAYSRPDIVSLCLLIPCVMAAILVPIVFIITSRLADWKAGIIAGFFIAICPGQFFFRSYYGYFDHHIGEVLFSTIFCLFYISALVYCRDHPVITSDKTTWRIPLILGFLCGVSYVIGLALMPTMILFALLVGIFTPVWFLIQKYQGDYCVCVLLVNVTTFLIAIIGFFIIGVHGEDGLNYYTVGHPLAYGLIILVSLILFGISWLLRNHSFFNYILTLLIVTIFGFLLFAIMFPDFFNYLLNNAYSFFG
ncbi:MAG: oligosaccharyl transferase, archaeosortase A system-associated, partial [Methanomicrobiales archaeon HGW-Methanomicrobiales-4]